MASKAEFLREIYDAGIAAGLTDAAARVTAAQAALETGYGKHTKGFNLFGIKAGSSWKGDVQMLKTWEGVGGKKVRITDKFRKYASWEEAIKDRVAFMEKRFPGFNQAETMDQAYEKLRLGGKSPYATDGVEKGDPLTYQDKLNMIGGKIPGQKPIPPGDIPTAVGSELDTYDPNVGTKVPKGAPIPQTMSEPTRLQRRGILDTVLSTLDRGLHKPTAAEKGPFQFQPYETRPKGADMILAGQPPRASDRVISGGGLATKAGLDLTPDIESLMAGGKPIPRPQAFIDPMAKPVAAPTTKSVTPVAKPPIPAIGGGSLAQGVKVLMNAAGKSVKDVQQGIKIPKLPSMPDGKIAGALIEAGKQGPLSGFVRDAVRDEIYKTIGGAANNMLWTQAENVKLGQEQRKAAADKAAAEQKKLASAPVPLSRSAGKSARVKDNTEVGFNTITDALGKPSVAAAGTKATGSGNTTMAADLALLFQTGDAKLPTPKLTGPVTTKVSTQTQMKIDPTKVAPVPKSRLMGSVARVLAEKSEAEKTWEKMTGGLTTTPGTTKIEPTRTVIRSTSGGSSGSSSGGSSSGGRVPQGYHDVGGGWMETDSGSRYRIPGA